MGTKKYNPITPSRRYMSSPDFADLTRGASVEKTLIKKSTKAVDVITMVV